MDDRHIIDLYFSRSQQAITEASDKYGRYCHAIAYNILGSDQDAEECVNDTWMRSWEAMPPQRPSRLSAFLGKITRNLALNRYDNYHAKKRGEGEVPLVLLELEEWIGKDTLNEALDEKALTDAIAAYLRTQPLLRRMIFIRRYWYCNSIVVIAKQLSCTESKVKSTLFRMREELKNHLREEGIFL